jgi:hypothetical protein
LTVKELSPVSTLDNSNPDGAPWVRTRDFRHPSQGLTIAD